MVDVSGLDAVGLSRVLASALGEVDELRRRSDGWFGSWLEMAGAEFRAFVVAQELAEVLMRYADRDDIGQEPGVVDALSRFVSLAIARDDMVKKGRTSGGVSGHPKDLG